jgi:hypothetical protein
MPAIERGSQATARACQNSECRHVEELKPYQSGDIAMEFRQSHPEAFRGA